MLRDVAVVNLERVSHVPKIPETLYWQEVWEEAASLTSQIRQHRFLPQRSLLAHINIFWRSEETFKGNILIIGHLVSMPQESLVLLMQ